MNLKRSIFFTAALLLLACSKSDELTTTPDTTPSDGVEVAIGASSSASTKTSIDPDDQTKVRWSVGDAVYMWAKPADGGAYTFENKPFTLRYFSADFSDAEFWSILDSPMAEGDYIYSGIYPAPTSVSDNLVTYNIPTLQSGQYDGLYDIRTAKPITSSALLGYDETTPNIPELSFASRTHAFKITIPENNLGTAITKIDVIFEQDVVGDMSFDIDDITAAPTQSNGSNLVTLSFDTPITTGDEAWFFIRPTTLSGDVQFMAYNTSNKISDVITLEIDKNCAEGRVTPVDFTVPGLSRDYTTVELTITANNLGEVPEKVYLTALNGAKFSNGLFENSFDYPGIDGTVSVVYHKDYADLFKNDGIAVTYESEHATVSASKISLSDVTEGDLNKFDGSVPYLFEQNFKGISNHDTDNLISTSTTTPASLAGWGLTSWSGDRVQVVSNEMCAVNYIYQAKRDLFGDPKKQYNNPGRVDSAPMSAINDNVKTGLKVTFKYYMSASSADSGDNVATMQFSYGTTTTSGNIAASDAIENVAKIISDESSYNSSNNAETYTPAGCTNSTRLSWRIAVSRSAEAQGAFSYNGQNRSYYIYIDNITVQIDN